MQACTALQMLHVSGAQAPSIPSSTEKLHSSDGDSSLGKNRNKEVYSF